MKEFDYVISNCPTCGYPLIWEGVHLVCKNIDCSIQSYKSLEYFLKTIGVMGISKTTLMNLEVSTIDELYSLTVDDIANKEGFGEKKANTIVDELKAKLTVSKPNFLASLGISGLGRTSSKLVLEHIDFDDVWTTKDFTFIKGIGQITSDNIVKGLSDNLDTYYKMIKFGLNWEVESSGSTFHGKTVTLTGKAPIKRDELIRLLENSGCNVKGISKKVDYLVTNDVEFNSGKTKKARDFGVPIITYDELLKGLE